MTELLALSVSVAVLGGIWAFIALGPLGGFALVWVGFIAAGCFFAAGGDIKALSKTIVGMIYGAIVAWIALLIIAKVPVPGLGTVWPAIEIGSRPGLYSFAKGLHASDVTLQPIGPDGQLRILYLALFQLRSSNNSCVLRRTTRTSSPCTPPPAPTRSTSLTSMNSISRGGRRAHLLQLDPAWEVVDLSIGVT